jgi:hypothetical protein
MNEKITKASGKPVIINAEDVLSKWKFWFNLSHFFKNQKSKILKEKRFTFLNDG